MGTNEEILNPGLANGQDSSLQSTTIHTKLNIGRPDLEYVRGMCDCVRRIVLEALMFNDKYHMNGASVLRSCVLPPVHLSSVCELSSFARSPN